MLHDYCQPPRLNTHETRYLSPYPLVFHARYSTRNFKGRIPYGTPTNATRNAFFLPGFLPSFLPFIRFGARCDYRSLSFLLFVVGDRSTRKKNPREVTRSLLELSLARTVVDEMGEVTGVPILRCYKLYRDSLRPNVVWYTVV